METIKPKSMKNIIVLVYISNNKKKIQFKLFHLVYDKLKIKKKQSKIVLKRKFRTDPLKESYIVHVTIKLYFSFHNHKIILFLY